MNAADMKAKHQEPQVKDIVQWIGSYRENIQAIRELQQSYVEDVGMGLVSQYGEEAGMPKAQGGDHSDVVAQNVLHLMRQNLTLQDLEHKVRYIENRQHRISKDTHAMAFALRLQGYTYYEAAQVMNRSKGHIFRLITECAEVMLSPSYPHNNETNETY
ncbi:hypothetical protein [Marinococcus halophilus]|uniref:hypothetical protein n=1 Tax=Marinococcus halophilus TaxID=1371 RepID=UPI0009A8CF1E|nr:hypothetical protein [Marinococcus halophilus]